MGAITQALNKKEKYKGLEDEAREYGVYFLSFEVDLYITFRSRLQTNPRLVEALEDAKKAGIFVWLARKFYTTTGGHLWIDVTASDEEIIKFLVG